MEIRDLFQGCNQAFRNSEPTFQTRLLYAELSSPYDVYSESKFGYVDGANKCLEGNMSAEDLIEYIESYSKENEPLSSYDKAYVQAMKDYIKQEVTNGK